MLDILFISLVSFYCFKISDVNYYIYFIDLYCYYEYSFINVKYNFKIFHIFLLMYASINRHIFCVLFFDGLIERSSEYHLYNIFNLFWL